MRASGAATKLKLVRSVTPTDGEVSVETLRTLIESGQSGFLPDALVTPEIAELLLRYNNPGHTNRKIIRDAVMSYGRIMKSGKWENTGEPIIISDQNLLNDGSQRLTAAFETGVSVRMDIRFGISRRAFMATNSGRKRTGGDALVMLGGAAAIRSAQIASAIRLALCYETGLPTAIRNRVLNQEIVAAVERWPDLMTSQKHMTGIPRNVACAPLRTLAFFASRTAPEASVAEFFHILRTGEGPASAPPHMLREVLMRRGTGNDSGVRLHLFALSILAWNAWRSKSKKTTQLRWRPTMDKFPTIEGLKL